MISVAKQNFDTLEYAVRSWAEFRFAVIGATALTIRGHPPPRRSEDVDVTIAAEPTELAELRKSLQPVGWERVHRDPYRWRHDRLNLYIDVVPAGTEPGKKSQYEIGHGLVLDVRGLEVALATAEPVIVGCEADARTLTAPTPPLSVLVLLKIIAYDDKPEVREKDVHDVARITLDYLHLDAERRWSPPISSVEEEDYKGAAALGMDMQGFLRTGYRDVVEGFFRNEVVRSTFSKIVKLRYGDYVENAGREIALAFFKGLDSANH